MKRSKRHSGKCVGNRTLVVLLFFDISLSGTILRLERILSPTRSKGQHGGRRPGQGRPPTLDHPVRYLLTIEKADLEKLEMIAEKRQKSIASLVRTAVKSYLKRHGS
jgi:hypothetical protein